MRYFEAHVDIDAPTGHVWEELVDAGNWPSWDSGVDSVDGRGAPGEKITVRSVAAPGRAFPVRVTTFDAPGRLVVTGGMPLGLFRGGVRTYTIDQAEGGCRFTRREEYSGPLTGLIWRSMPDLGPSLRQFAEGLKQRVEHDTVAR
jgi:uncharacterized protein YndB with AHSA1/START domain